MNDTTLTARRGWPVAFTQSALSVGFALLIGLGAQLKIYLPFTPVPVTFQTLFLLIGASTLRRFYSLQMIGWYLVLGSIGVPLFAGQTTGMSWLSGPTGGYLVGFVIATYLLGFFQGGSWRQLLLFLAAHTAIFVPGLLWLHVVTGSGWDKTLAMGLYPFIVGDLLKSATAFATWLILRRNTSVC